MSPSHGFKRMSRRLKSSYSVSVNKEDISEEKLSQSQCHIISNPNSPFTRAEFDCLSSYVSSGGSLMFLLSEGECMDVRLRRECKLSGGA